MHGSGCYWRRENMGIKYSCKIPHDYYVLIFSHSNFLSVSAGVEKYIRDEIRLLNNNNISAVSIYPINNNLDNKIYKKLFGKYYGVIINMKHVGIFSKEELIEFINQGILNNKYMCETQIHHIKYYDLNELDWILSQFDGLIRYFIHDFSSICKNHLMLRNDIEFCNSKGINFNECNGCKYYEESLKHYAKISSIFKKYRQRLSVVSPSQSAAVVWKNAFDFYNNEVNVIPHVIEENFMLNKYKNKLSGDKLRVAFVGAPLNHKGWADWIKITKSTKESRYEFYHMGTKSTDIGPWKEVYVSATKSNENAMTKAIIDNKIDIVLILTHCAETFCYSLFESIIAESPLILAYYNSGNVADVICNEKRGILFNNYLQIIDYFKNYEKVINDVNNYRSRTEIPTILKNNTEIIKLIKLNKDVNICSKDKFNIHYHFLANIFLKLKSIKRMLIY